MRGNLLSIKHLYVANFAAGVLSAVCMIGAFVTFTSASQPNPVGTLPLIENNCPLPAQNPHVFGIYEAIRYLHIKCEYTVRGVLDIGANNGQWSLDLKHFLVHLQQQETRFFLMEGNEAHTESLSKSGFPFHIGLVADVEKDVTYYLRPDVTQGSNTGNSMFKEVGWGEETAVHTRALTVDKVLLASGSGPFNFMKIDVQGAEVLVLNGSKETLKHVDVIATEASIQNYNAGGTTFYELHHTMNLLGFAMYDVIDTFRFDPRDAHLIQIDFLWVRKDSFLWDEKCTGLPPRTGYGTPKIARNASVHIQRPLPPAHFVFA
jgi:FkbM family methyltransferase